MQIKIFNLRLNAAYSETDQDAMNAFLKDVDFKKSSTQFVAGEESYWSVLVHYEEEEPASPPAEKVPKAASKKEDGAAKEDPAQLALTPEEETVYQTLRHWRQTKAGELDLPPFMVAHNAELMEIARLRPQTLQMLGEIKGFGKQKTERFGEEIIAVLNAL